MGDANDSDPPQLVIDYEKGLDTFGGDDEMYKMMLENFESMTLNSSMENLNKFFEEKKWTELRREAHSMKGASGYIAADHFSEVSYELQKAAEAAEEEKIKSCLEKVKEEEVRLRKRLRELLES